MTSQNRNAEIIALTEKLVGVLNNNSSPAGVAIDASINLISIILSNCSDKEDVEKDVDSIASAIKSTTREIILDNENTVTH